MESPKKVEKESAKDPESGSYGPWILIAAGILTAGIVVYRTVAKK